jgi:DNA-binding LytR/AlgR family response regulator
MRPLAGKRVLVLEDDFYLASDEKTLLEEAGATIMGPFGSACAERDIIEAGPLDAAVVDINLGSAPSFDFARFLASRAVPFVFVTGYDQAVIPPDLAHAPRIEKPIREQELVAAVTRLMGAQV